VVNNGKRPSNIYQHQFGKTNGHQKLMHIRKEHVISDLLTYRMGVYTGIDYANFQTNLSPSS
jgi:hypothetical protein